MVPLTLNSLNRTLDSDTMYDLIGLGFFFCLVLTKYLSIRLT